MKTFTKVLLSAILLIFSVSQVFAQYRLQLLHASDLEGGVSSVGNAPRFAALVDTFYKAYPNSILLSAGDNYIPGPFFNAAADLAVRDSLRKVLNAYYGITNANTGAANGRIDISIMNICGFNASAFGNHEWDAGSTLVSDLLSQNVGQGWTGAQFPYLSCNLNLRPTTAFSNLFVGGRPSDSTFKSSFTATTKRATAAATIITRGGERIGVIGVTTPLLESISSPSPVSVKNPGSGTNNMQQLATIIQPYIDSMQTVSGVNKVILVTHLQQIQLEQQLVTLLNNVDIVIAGGSSAILADNTDRLRPGDAAFGTYPILANTADNKPCLIVSSGDEYKYLGRLVVDFNAAGEVIPTSVDRNISGSYVTDSASVIAAWGSYNAAFRANSKASLVKTLVDAVRNVVLAKDGALVGKTSVYLEGRRNFVRSQETNLGSLTADANLWYARAYDATVSISLKNGGGIRSEIGEVNETSPGVFATLPPAPNPLANKLRGDVSRLDIENSLRFDNKLSLVSVNAAQLRRLMEHGVSAWTATATPGAFCQIGGVRFSFDPSLPARARIRNLVAINSAGSRDTVVLAGNLRGDSARTFRVVTLNFLAGGGDSYPFAGATRRVDLDTALRTAGNIPYFVAGGEQDALAEYLFNFHRTTPFALRETPIANDTRIQNLSLRADDVLVSVANRALASELKLYPNPASALVKIETKLSIVKASAIGSDGKVFSLPIWFGESALDVAHLAKGVYTVLIETDKGVVAKKLIIQ